MLLGGCYCVAMVVAMVLLGVAMAYVGGCYGAAMVIRVFIGAML